MFQNLRANNQLFILHKDENPLVDIGSVVSVSAAKPKYPMPTPIGQLPQMEMVVDVVVCVNGQNTTFQNLPAGADIADFGQNGNIVISCSREAMNSEMCIRDRILTLLNPEFAEKQRQEQEIATLKGQMSEMSRSMADLMAMNKKLMEQLGASETSKNKK